MNSAEVDHGDNRQNMTCNVCRDIQGYGLVSTEKSNISVASQNVDTANKKSDLLLQPIQKGGEINGNGPPQRFNDVPSVFCRESEKFVELE
jgi:hypothetical protein